MNDALLVSATTFGIQAFVTLFVIMDPPGATPIFLALVKDQPSRKRILMAWQGATVSLIVIVAFAIFEALQGAGGLLLLLIALELLTGRDSTSDKAKDVNVALVPLGTPLLAGPGAIVTTIVFVQNADTVSMKFALAAAIVAVHVAIGLTLMFSTKIVSVIKESGVTLVARIAGLLLAAIAVEMIVQAIKGFFNL